MVEQGGVLGEINLVMIFGEMFIKETSYLSNKDVFSGKSFKRDFLQKQIYGKRSKSLLFFFKKDIEISKQSFNKQKYILLLSARI